MVVLCWANYIGPRWLGNRGEDVSPLQGLGFLWRDTRAFSPGYHMAGLRPFGIGAGKPTLLEVKTISPQSKSN